MVKYVLIALAVYAIVTAPLALLFMQSATFRAVTAAEITRKLAHVRPLDYALVGDSLTAQWPAAGAMLGGNRFSALNLGAPGAVLSQIGGQLDNAARLKPRRLSIAAGTNDRLQGRSDQEIVQAFDDVLAHAQRLGFASVIVTSIPVPRDFSQDARILALNANLQAKVKGAGWRFVDLNATVLQAPDRAALYQPDGLHFSPRMYELWAAAMAGAP